MCGGLENENWGESSVWELLQRSWEQADRQRAARVLVARWSRVGRLCCARVPLVFRLYSCEAIVRYAIRIASPCDGIFVATGRAAARHVGAEVRDPQGHAAQDQQRCQEENADGE